MRRLIRCSWSASHIKLVGCVPGKLSNNWSPIADSLCWPAAYGSGLWPAKAEKRPRIRYNHFDYFKTSLQWVQALKFRWSPAIKASDPFYFWPARPVARPIALCDARAESLLERQTVPNSHEYLLLSRPDHRCFTDLHANSWPINRDMLLGCLLFTAL